MAQRQQSEDTAASLPGTGPPSVDVFGCRAPVGEPAPAVELPKAVRCRGVPAGADLDHPGLYFNQELSWLDFNWRVLALALDERTPLLERVRFVAIAASNLDEFFQKRVGGLKRQYAADVRHLSPDGRTPAEQLALITDAARVMHKSMTEAWERVLKPLLRRQAGILICDYADLDRTHQTALDSLFERKVYPILTPLAVDPGRPFPFISDLSLSLAVIVRENDQNTTRFARVKVPANLDRWLGVEPQAGEDCWCFVPVEQLIAHHIGELFRGVDVVGVYPFRITRNADLRRDEEEAEDLLALISEELRKRRFAPVVRLEVASDMPQEVRAFLAGQLGLGRDDIYEVAGLLDLSACTEIADLDRPQLRYAPWKAVAPPGVDSSVDGTEEPDIFDVIRRGDMLLHHPYASFEDSVQRLVEQAADDPCVLAIKQTIYRTSHESPIVNALVRAAGNGKQVAVLVEVKARFDEANNIEWGRMLENAGVHVAYGLVGLKTHAKALLIVREEGNELRTICHVGTGNYNAHTARLYTDLSLMTCDPDLGSDLVGLFHYLTGYSPDQEYNKILVAPRDMRRAFTDLIRQEIAHQRNFGNGRIIAKMNALDDVGIVRELYAASQAGVQIDLIVRGHVTLRPGLREYSENIRVISILGRFLEHDRVFYFQNNNQPLTYIGSADWRKRNLEERVELVAPIEAPALQRQLVSMLEDALADNCWAWDLDADGSYTQRRPGPGEHARQFQRDSMSPTGAWLSQGQSAEF